MQPQSPPGTTEYEVPLTAEDYMRVRIRTERGCGVVAFTVQYELTMGARTYPVVRYDSWHEDPHRDLPDHEGRNLDKLCFPCWPYADVLNHGRNDIVANWPQYRADFLRRLP